jgi:hypothetical protein
MSTYSYLFACALLATPPDLLELPEAAKLFDTLGPDLKAIAMHLELLDPRETYVLEERDQFAGDLKLLQERYRDLRAAPPLGDSLRFPDREMVGELLAFNRRYREGLDNRLNLDRVHSEDLKAALSETDFLYRVWDKVRDVHCEYHYVTYRRQALQELREMVGPRAYYTGQLPPHVPLWRIPVAD